jgi:flagellar motility protein MotE (MotC chaperone)
MQTYMKAYKSVAALQKPRGFLLRLQESLTRLVVFRIRLIPLVIFFATLILTVRINTFYGRLSQEGFFSAREALATNNQPANPNAMATTALSAAGGKGDQNEKASETLDLFNMTPEQIRVLQGLAKRQEQLLARERAIPEKEKVLQALVVKIETKIKELKTAHAELKRLVDKIDEEDNANIKRLVNMAEGMKPAVAAKVLEGVEFPILLEIMEKMREKSASAIMAAMEADKASYLMSALAKRRKLFKKGQPDKGIMQD